MLLKKFRLVRYVMIAVVLVISYWGFWETRRFPDPGMAGVLQRIYASIALFFFSGIDIDFPHQGARAWQALLYLCYFLAPLLTVSYIYEIAQDKLINRLSLNFKKHTVICGLGRSGRVIYELLREVYPAKHKVVLIDQNPENPYAAEYQQHRNTWWIKADFTKRPVLKRASVHRAQRIFLTTDMDLDNLNALIHIQTLVSTMPLKQIKRHRLDKVDMRNRLYCHITDHQLRENLQATLFKEEKYQGVQILNGFYSAAKRLYLDYVTVHLNAAEAAAAGIIFIFFGYGFFGKMVYHHIQSDDHRSADDEIYITTLLKKSGYDIDLTNYAWETEQHNRCTVHKPIINDIQDPSVWKMLDDQIVNSPKKVVLFLCRDHDVANLELAISIKRKGPQSLKRSTIFCRMFMETTPELEQMLENRLTPGLSKDVILFPVQRELKAAFREELFGD